MENRYPPVPGSGVIADASAYFRAVSGQNEQEGAICGNRLLALYALARDKASGLSGDLARQHLLKHYGCLIEAHVDSRHRSWG